LMAMMNFMSHGTQDLYPTFLQRQLHFGTRTTAIINVVSMLGAIAGGILFGLYSDRRGRRRSGRQSRPRRAERADGSGVGGAAGARSRAVSVPQRARPARRGGRTSRSSARG